MKIVVLHEIKGRIRLHLVQKKMSFEEADSLQYYLEGKSSITSCKVYDRTCDVVINYQGNREEIIEIVKAYSYDKVQIPEE